MNEFHTNGELGRIRAGQSNIAGIASGALAGYATQTADSLTEPAPTTVLEAIERQAAEDTKALINIMDRLANLRERVFGPEPSTPATKGDGPPVAGAMHRVSAALAPHDALISRINNIISELDQIA